MWKILCEQVNFNFEKSGNMHEMEYIWNTERFRIVAKDYLGGLHMKNMKKIKFVKIIYNKKIYRKKQNQN